MNKFRINIQVSISPSPDDAGMVRGYGNLQISENVEITATSFLELCDVLAQFDKLARSMVKK